METYNKYDKELAQEFVLNSINIKEVLYKLPAKKHFWASRLVQHKVEVQKLKKAKTKLISVAKTEGTAQSRIKFSKENDSTLLDALPQIETINDRIHEQECIIELLNNAIETFKSMDWQIKSLLQLMTMEM